MPFTHFISPIHSGLAQLLAAKNHYSPSVLSSLELARGCLQKSINILSVLPLHQPSILFKYATRMKLQMGSWKTGFFPAALSSFKQYCGFIQKGDWADNDKSISSSFAFFHKVASVNCVPLPLLIMSLLKAAQSGKWSLMWSSQDEAMLFCQKDSSSLNIILELFTLLSMWWDSSCIYNLKCKFQTFRFDHLIKEYFFFLRHQRQAVIYYLFTCNCL